MIGAKHTPGCAFLFFLQEKTVTQCMLGRDGHNAKVYTLCCGYTKNCAGCKNRSGLLFLFVPFFPSVFCCCGCFASCKTSVAFFVWCCFLAFWLCSFARGRAFLGAGMSLCLCLWLANTKAWFSPFPTVFFLLALIFFCYNWIVVWSCFFAVVFLAPLAWPFSGAVCSFRLLLLVPLCTKCNKLVLCFFAALLLSFLMSFWAVAGVAFFSLCPPVIMHAKQCLPCALPYPASPTIRFPPFPNTHMHPSNTCGCTCTLFTHAHMVISVLVCVLVFVCLLRALCVCACLCLGLLVCLCLCFAFFYVSVVALCAYEYPQLGVI